MRIHHVFIAATLMCLGGCAVCDPGEEATCVCAGGIEGVQVCGGGGDTWGACDCGTGGPGDDDAVDADGDGYDASVDCDDEDPDVHPGAEELICDHDDNDCDPATPDNPGTDGDGDGDDICIDCDDADPALNFRDDDGDGYATCNFDCDDSDAEVHDHAEEVCDGKDNDCDAIVPADEFDADADGVMACDGDCDDQDATVYLDATELCDGKDNDCDGSLPAEELDADADGQRGCEGDCDDDDVTVYLGAIELCEGKDNDCDGNVPADELDADGDGFVGCDGDCDDTEPTVHAGAPDVCDAYLDNDCDGLADPLEADDDGDGASECELDCDDADPSLDPLDVDGDGITSCDGDCDDGDAGVIPGAVDTCDGVDTDCNGVVDDADQDADGWTACDDCDDSDALLEQDDADGDGWTTCDGDCDDADPAIAPLTYDGCDGVDRDCNGVPDDGDGDGDGWTACVDCDDADAALHLDDADADGWSPCGGDCDDSDPALNPADDDLDGWSSCDGDCDDGDPTLELDDTDGDGWNTCDDDCDDLESAIFPGAPEVPYDAIDQDCDGADLIDVDGDGFEGGPDGDDCDDEDPAAFPGNAEVCDGADNDCNGSVDDGAGFHVVPDQHATIQGAIDAGTDGDTICVAAGTYAEAIDTDGLILSIIGRSGPEATTIDGGGASNAMILDGDYGTGAVLQGLTVTGGGNGLYVTRVGATITDVVVEHNNRGIYLSSTASMTLTRSWVRDNYPATVDGAGIYLYPGSQASLSHVLISGNATADSSGLAGGGIYVDTATLSMTNCIVEGNEAYAGSGGIGMVGSTVSLYNVLVANNRAVHDNNHSADGGGIGCATTDAHIYNVAVLGNESDSGGGIDLTLCDADLIHVSVIGNTASWGSGGGLYIAQSDPTLRDCDISFNTSVTTGGGFYKATYALSYIDGSYLNFWANSPDDANIGYGAWTGILHSDPIYMLYAGDALDWDTHLAPWSPLVDAGSPSYIDPDGSRGDIGMYGGAYADDWDLDWDGHPIWWMPGSYDHATYPGAGWDCDDRDGTLTPEDGC